MDVVSAPRPLSAGRRREVRRSERSVWWLFPIEGGGRCGVSVEEPCGRRMWVFLRPIQQQQGSCLTLPQRCRCARRSLSLICPRSPGSMSWVCGSRPSRSGPTRRSWFARWQAFMTCARDAVPPAGSTTRYSVGSPTCRWAAKRPGCRSWCPVSDALVAAACGGTR